MEEDNFDLDYSLSLPQATITLDELCSLDDSEAGIEIFEPSFGLSRTAKEEIIDKELEFEPLSDRNTDLEAEPNTPHTTRSSSRSFSTIIEDAPTPMTAFSLQKLPKAELIIHCFQLQKLIHFLNEALHRARSWSYGAEAHCTLAH